MDLGMKRKRGEQIDNGKFGETIVHTPPSKRGNKPLFSLNMLFICTVGWRRKELKGESGGYLKHYSNDFNKNFENGEKRETEGQGQKLYLDDPIQFSFNKIHLCYIRIIKRRMTPGGPRVSVFNSVLL